MARGHYDRHKEQHWRRHVAAWRRSGQSVRAYCAAQGLSEPSFYAWRKTLRERDGGGDTKARHSATIAQVAASPAVSPFVPVRLVEAAPASAAVEVVLRGGWVVRVTDGFTAQTLRAVLAALEGLPC
jgi:transposase-like protein